MTDRSLADWLSYLEQLHPSAIDMGLDRVRRVAERLGLGRPASRVVTVTGTNGKGSTCAFLASLFASEGLRVGVYSSPHLVRYNERVAIEGNLASDQALCNAFAAVDSARGDISLTYFEMGTLAAFWLFQRAALDVAILEVGLGGRLDAVNLVDADLAIVTSIGLDHAEWLGNTRESVAKEKAGIFRAGKPGICGDADPPEVLEEIARTTGVDPWLVRGRHFHIEQTPDGWSWHGRNARGDSVVIERLPLLDLPMENAALAIQAFQLLDGKSEPGKIADALKATKIVGRLDHRRAICQGRPVNLLLDVGHNPHAANFLARQLGAGKRSGRRLAVFGLLGDKDLAGILDELLPLIDQWSVATLDSSRARPAEALAAALEDRGATVYPYATVADALDATCRTADADDQILVFGSFYCVAECLHWLDRHAGETVDGLVG